MNEIQYHCCDSETGKEILSAMPDIRAVDKLAMFYKIFGDPTRLKLLHCLLENELCVHDLASLVDISQSAISHQLSLLKRENLIKTRRDGKYIYYSLDDEHVKMIYETGLEHINHL